MKSLSEELDELATSLEEAVQLASTRYEHMRVAAHAARARNLAVRASQETGQEASKPLAATG